MITWVDTVMIFLVLTNLMLLGSNVFMTVAWYGHLRFKEVPPHQLPRGEATISSVPSVTAGHDMHFVSAVLERWRGATSQRDVPNDPVFSGPGAKTLANVEAPMLQPSMGLDPDRFSLLKKPLR